MNLFVYVSNNPMNFIDPQGTESLTTYDPITELFIKQNKPEPLSPAPSAGTRIPGGEAGNALQCLVKCLGYSVSLMVTGGSECTLQGFHTPTSKTPNSKHCTEQAFDLSPSSVRGPGEKRVLCCAITCGIKYAKYEPRPAHYHFQTVKENTRGILPKEEECCPIYR